MRSTQRGRARSRLRTSKPVNIMFSNGLGVCRGYAGAGQQSVCRRRTRDTTQPLPELYVTQQVTSPTTNPVTFSIFTNIIGATMTISDATGVPAGAGLTLAIPSPAISVYGEQQILLSQAVELATTYAAVKLTLTGGVMSTGNPHNVTSVTLNTFDVDNVLPVITLISKLDNPWGPYMNMAATFSIFEINSSKAGIPTLHYPTPPPVAPTLPTFTPTTIGALPAVGVFELDNTYGEGAYPQLTVTVVDALGNISNSVIIAATGDVVAPAVAPDNAFIIDKTPPTAPAAPVAQAAGLTMDIPMELTTAAKAPFKEVLFSATTGIILTGVQGLALTVTAVNVIQPTPADAPFLQVTVAPATTGPDPTGIELEYNPAAAGLTDATKIQDEAQNLMPSFGPITIAII